MKIKPGYEIWSELELLTGAIVGEARGEPQAGRIGVAITIATRVSQPCWWGRNWREVILMDRQFSCWDDHNADVIIASKKANDSLWLSCRQIAVNVYLGTMADHIGQPTHYHAANITPSWAGKLTRLAQIGRHIFYR